MKELQKHLDGLHNSYIKATPKQRIKVALDRLNTMNSGPNRIIVLVSAVEGIARAMLLNKKVLNGGNVEDEYKKIKYEKPLNLVKQVCKEYGKSPKNYFGEKVYSDFKMALEYRNLLIHECTFLRQELSKQLIVASTEVFNKLSNLAKL